LLRAGATSAGTEIPSGYEEIDELLRCLAQFLTTKKDTVALTSDHREYAD
jgi:hypothetical protein